MAKARSTQPSNRQFGEVIPPTPPTLAPKRRKSPAPPPKDLGPLEHLLGTWTAKGTGWNMIALPFQNAPAPPAGFQFRVLMNQYDEELNFSFVDDNVANRGLLRPDDPDADQFVVTLDYQQKISQVAAEDRPVSGAAGPVGLPIHHEPGLWLFMKNRKSKVDHIFKGEAIVDIARLASIPHGNSVLAVGSSEVVDGMPEIPALSGMPLGRFEDISTPEYDFKTDAYLEPYKHYIDNPFMGNVSSVGFPGFSPADMNAILRFANTGVDIVRTTVLTVDSTQPAGGVRNIPFAVREAEPVSMKSTFWIQELREKDDAGNPKFRLQYAQVVMLDFFSPREDELPGKIGWPHISIATLEREPGSYGLVGT